MQKRVAFSTIESTPPEAGITPEVKAATTGEKAKGTSKEKKAKKAPKTYRFELKLRESNNNTFAEFYYDELVKSREETDNGLKKEASKGRLEPGADSFGDGDEDQQCKALAAKFEEKYGQKKKKNHSAWEDYVDKGQGYDETDPFIDNGEAYDELIPSTLTTKLGGFYINSGELTFRPLSEDEVDDEESKQRKRIKTKSKRIAENGSDVDLNPVKRKKLINPLDKMAKKGVKGSPKDGTVAQLLEQNRQDAKQTAPVSLLHKQPNSKPEDTEGAINLSKSSKKCLRITDSDEEEEMEDISDDEESDSKVKGLNASYDSVIESVAKGVDRLNGATTGGTSGNSSDNSDVVIMKTGPVPKLPDNLPAGLDECVENLKSAALCSEEGSAGKQRFFSKDVNKILLEVEVKCRENMNATQRNQVYAHLAHHLPCTKDTLMKRAKKLRLENEEGKMHGILAKLRDEVAVIMNGLNKHYTESYDAATSRHEAEKAENPDIDVGPKYPKKEFKWSERSKVLFRQATAIKRSVYEQMSALKSQSEDDYLMEFFKNEVIAIWPQGWMSAHKLLRITKVSRPIQVLSQPNRATAPASAFVKKPSQNAIGFSINQLTSQPVSTQHHQQQQPAHQQPAHQQPAHTQPQSQPLPQHPHQHQKIHHSNHFHARHETQNQQLRYPTTSTPKSESSLLKESGALSLTARDRDRDRDRDIEVLPLPSQSTPSPAHGYKQRQSTPKAQQYPEGLLCSIDKLLSNRTGPSLSKSMEKRPSSPAPSPVSGKASPKMQVSGSVISSSHISSGGGSRSSPTSLLKSTPSPSSVSPLVAHSTPLQHKQPSPQSSQQTSPQQKAQLSPQHRQSEPQTHLHMKTIKQPTSEPSGGSSSGYHATTCLERIIQTSLKNYPSSNVNPKKEKTEKQQTHKQTTLSGSSQQSNKMPSMSFVMEEAIRSSLNSSSSPVRTESKATHQQHKVVQQGQGPHQIVTMSSRTSPLPHLGNKSASASLKQAAAHSQLQSKSKRQQQLPGAQGPADISTTPITQGSRHFASSISVASPTTTLTSSQQGQHLALAQLQQHMYYNQLITQMNPNVAHFMTPTSSPSTSSVIGRTSAQTPATTSSAHQYIANLNSLVHRHHSYAAPPPGDGRR